MAVYDFELPRSFHGAHTFMEPGTYTVQATATGVGSHGNAEASRSTTITAKPVPPQPQVPRPATKPTISVVDDGPATSASFAVTGSNFVGNRSVHIRVVNNFTLQNGFVTTTSDSSGRINHEINVPCESGVQLSFSANDGRDNPNDLTGTLWSNTVTVTAS